jgi:hypothetical protein
MTNSASNYPWWVTSQIHLDLYNEIERQQANIQTEVDESLEEGRKNTLEFEGDDEKSS